MLKLYDYAASGNCYKVRLLLAQLERQYERVPIDIFAGDTLTDEYAAKNPARSTPVLELEDGRCLSESFTSVCSRISHRKTSASSNVSSGR